MLWLSNEAIEYAVAKCRREPGYKVGIALNSRARNTQIELCLRECLRDTDEFRVRRSVCNMTVEFHNGSYIRVIPASDNARGYRMHLLIADENINDDVLNCVLRPCENLEWVERQRRRYDEETLRRDFRREYLSRPYEPSVWEMELMNVGEDKDFADVSESEFMKILNIPIPQ